MRGLAFLHVFGGRRLHVRFRPNAVYSVEIVERPSETLSPEQTAAIIADCRTVVAACIGGKQLDYGLFSADGRAWGRSVITLVRRAEDGAPVAFNAMPLLPINRLGQKEDVLHLGLVMVDPSERSGGLSWILYGLTCFALFLRRGMRPLWVSSVTQVPAVVGMVASTFDHVFPGQTGTEQSFAHRQIAHQIMLRERLAFGVGDDAGFDADRQIITNAYTGGSDNLKKTFDEAAKHRDAEFNAFCARELDYQRGDDVLQIGRIDLSTARRFLKNSVPRSAIPQLAVQGLYVAVSAIIAPTLQWLKSRQPLGRLRPVR